MMLNANRRLYRGGYMALDRFTPNPIARLRPVPDTERFKLFYWSNVKVRWTTSETSTVGYPAYSSIN
jgi:hypothetical protein